MANKYSFFDLRDKAKRGIPLPADVNEYVKVNLARIGFADVIPFVDRKQAHIQYGELTVHAKDNPAKRLVIAFRCGMVTHYDMIEDITASPSGNIIIDKARIKNPRLDTNVTNKGGNDE